VLVLSTNGQTNEDFFESSYATFIAKGYTDEDPA
jgi:hypothetical protein